MVLYIYIKLCFMVYCSKSCSFRKKYSEMQIPIRTKIKNYAKIYYKNSIYLFGSLFVWLFVLKII